MIFPYVWVKWRRSGELSGGTGISLKKLNILNLSGWTWPNGRGAVAARHIARAGEEGKHISPCLHPAKIRSLLWPTEVSHPCKQKWNEEREMCLGPNSAKQEKKKRPSYYWPTTQVHMTKNLEWIVKFQKY